MFKKHIFSGTVKCCSASFSAQCCSDWSALTCLSRQRSPCFHVSSASVFAIKSVLRGVAEGDDCVVVTSQCNVSPDSSFEGTVSKYGLCAFILWIERFDTLPVYKERLDVLDY